MAKRILRPSQIYSGPKGSRPGTLPISRTTFYLDFVHRDDEPIPTIPGTNVERMTLIPLGNKAVGVAEDDHDRVIDELATQRLTDNPKRMDWRTAVRAAQERAREKRAREKLTTGKVASTREMTAD